MKTGAPTLFHALVSTSINTGLLDPMAVCRAAEAAFHAGRAPLNGVEGFIRQILGWREFIRGIYWLRMPEYASRNALQATRKLPQFYWDGQTEMNCLHHAVTDTRANAYAHHIQRLMITGNFALLAGLQPDEVDEWYLIVYADAYEWVEMPNVRGMALFCRWRHRRLEALRRLRRLHQQDERLLPRLSLRREAIHRRSSLPVQRALLGLHGPQRRPPRRQPAHGDADANDAEDGSGTPLTPCGSAPPPSLPIWRPANPSRQPV